ncbi:DHH family phosphoesterase [Lascolabacillus massiliensis]|jgi:phosphoesterase RecJ-like protein|uniref:DHH family phosphoesterase n=1 Tax=Lascolabacillus massiliensis TaxID=1627894 RepID=UPI0006B39FF7|nr:bifunctional oligoribonuclease/PAP phosphatase NrnA [Lascolabacillus massiliensis]MBP7105175.1 bifunctional oligoribonuclease/PAP phosphatase NrnA [Fermentimonas sp.]MCK9501735.1 bifunctional oligoribonuclease/PAP phosphatase NrnA [Lascolabacillus sp.]
MHNLPYISEVIEPHKVEQIIDYIDNSDKIVITTHISPDGDAIGSSLALYHFIKNRGKNVMIIVPNSFPYFLKWMDGANNIEIFEYNPSAGAKILSYADLIFSLDYNILKRAGEMSTVLETSKAKKIMIDHHPFPGEDFDIIVSKPHISSTSELIFRFIYQAGEYSEMTKAEAESIYCGMMTDTGGFTYNSADPEIYEIISMILRKDIDKDAIYSKVFNNYSEERFRLLGFTLSQRMEVYHDKHAALLYLSNEDQSQFRYSKGDTEGFVNYPLSIKGIIFSTFIREEEGMVKISFRSQKSFRCNEFASEFFNGGGHVNASGGEFQGSLEEALKIYSEGLEKYKERLIMAVNED